MRLTPKKFQTLLLNWFENHGRKNLPWQHNKTPYRVWVSEIMLQQTQVATVIPYFKKFMQRFPTLESLAQAHPDEVLHLWTGLGYYSRARNLHLTSKFIGSDKNFPNNLAELMALPGIGRSTAGAILAIAFKQSVSILDGNVKRVLSRVIGITDALTDKKTLNTLWDIATAYTPQTATDTYTQAIMDLGATLCVRSKPFCQQCPLQKYCFAFANNLQQQIPAKTKKVAMPTKKATFIFLRHGNEVVLGKRPTAGIWGGLWAPLELANHLTNDQLILPADSKIAVIKRKKTFRHTFTHFHLNLLPIIVNLKSKFKLADANQIWYNLQQPQALGLPQPIKKILLELQHDPIDLLRQTQKRSPRLSLPTLPG